MRHTQHWNESPAKPSNIGNMTRGGTHNRSNNCDASTAESVRAKAMFSLWTPRAHRC